MKVLHCPATVGGNPQGLARAERQLGCDSVSWTFTQNLYRYPADRVMCRSSQPLLRGLMRAFAIARMLGRFDVVHFNFGESFAPRRIATDKPGRPRWLATWYNRWVAGPLELRDVAWARRMGAIVAVTFQGDDARQGDYCRRRYPVHFVHEVAPDYYTAELDRQKQERIRFFDRHADVIYALNPDLLNVLPARTRFLAYASVDPREWVPTPRPPANASEPLVIHAPSHREVKGTRHVLAAVERLQAEGVRFQFRLVEGLAHAEARKLYESADLVVDQLLAGFYGAFAVELMALAKPVICQLNHDDLAMLPAGMRGEMPLVHADPATIETTLRALLTTRRHELAEIGARSRRYVEHWHDPLKIAADVVADYRAAVEQRGSRRPRGG